MEGDREEIKIEIDLKKLRQKKISLIEVADALKEEILRFQVEITVFRGRQKRSSPFLSLEAWTKLKI